MGGLAAKRLLCRGVNPYMGAKSFVAAVLALAACLAGAQVLLPHFRRPFGPMSPAEATKVADRIVAEMRSAQAVPPGSPNHVRQVLTADSKELVRLMSSRDLGLAAEAVYEAGGRRNNAFTPSLTRIALHGPASCVPVAIDALGSIGTPAARRTLRLAVASPVLENRLLAGLILAESGDAAGKPAVLEGLHAKVTPYTTGLFRDKRRIALALIRLGYGRRRSDLDDLLTFAGTDKRLVLPTLAKTGWPAVPRKLVALLGDRREYHGVRKWSAIALGQIRYRPAVKPLIGALKDPDA